MNKWTKIALAAVALMMISALTLTPTFAQETPSDSDNPTVEERIRNFARKNFNRWHRGAHDGQRGMGQQAEVVAEALGITVADLQAAREEGKSLDALLAEQEMDRETFEANLKVAAIARINQKVEDGDLTQERADAMIERIENGEFRMKGRGIGKGRGHGHHGKRGMGQQADVVAEALGLTVEDLRAAREEGKTLADLLEEQGLDEETLQANLKAGAIAKVNQLLEDGEITQEKADKWIEKIESAEFNMNGRGFGKRGHGDGARGDDNDTTPGNTEESDTDGNVDEDERSADASGGDTLFRLTTLGQSGDMSLFLPVVSAAGQ